MKSIFILLRISAAIYTNPFNHFHSPFWNLLIFQNEIKIVLKEIAQYIKVKMFCLPQNVRGCVCVWVIADTSQFCKSEPFTENAFK